MDKKSMFKRLAVLCLTLVIGVAMTGVFTPLDSSAAARTSAKNWSKYTGTYTKYFKKGSTYPVYGVILKGGSGKAKIQVVYYGTNGSPIYCTYAKTVKVSSKGKCSFKWKDNWTNRGSGTIQIKSKKVVVTMKQTHKAKNNRYSLQTKGRTLKLHTKKVDFVENDEM